MSTMKRTPPAARSSSSQQQQQQISSFFTPSNKRSRFEVSEMNEGRGNENLVSEQEKEDVEELIKETGDINRAMLMMMQKNHSYVATRFDNLEENFSTIRNQLDDLGAEVSSLKTGLGATNNNVAGIQEKLDHLEQEKLASHMTINGIDAVQVDGNKKNMKSFVAEIIRSFNIQIEENQIEQAFSYPVGNAQRRINVIFNSSAIKFNIMAAKRASKDERKIFFDHRTTAKVGDLLRQLRAFTKRNGGKAFLYGGRVFFQKEPASKIPVNSPDDICSANLLPQ
jgi:chromosome segregation ATPase